jgi:hypothetical protein
MNEFVHHMVEFFTFEVFQWAIIILIEQVLNPKHFASIQINDVKFFPSSVQKTFLFINTLISCDESLSTPFTTRRSWFPRCMATL